MAAKVSTKANHEVHITYEDQQQINKFARVNGRLTDTKEEHELKKKELQNLEDALEELMLMEGEEETFPCQIGETFVDFSPDDANTFLEKQKESCSKEVSALEDKMQEHRDILSDLKIKLYAKFGGSINLEPEEE